MAESALEHAIAVEQHRVASAQIRLLRLDTAVEPESTFGDERSLDDHRAVFAAILDEDRVGFAPRAKAPGHV